MIVWGVSAVDIYWSIRNQEVLYENELNPVGALLIELDGGAVSLFMAVKCFGTMGVLTITPILFMYRNKLGYAVMCGVASCMCGLFYFLHWG